MGSRLIHLMVAIAVGSFVLMGCQGEAAPQQAPKAAEAPTAVAPAPQPAQKAAQAPASVAPAPQPVQKAAEAPLLPLPGMPSWPDKPVTIDVGTAGGGLDMLRRAVGDALQKENLFPGTITYGVHGGAGGNVLMAWLYQQRGSAYAMATNTNRVFTNPMMGTIDLGLDDFTPVARLTTDFSILAVSKDSRFKTLADLNNALKQNPRSVTFGMGSAPPGNDYLNVVRVAAAGGADASKLNTTVFTDAGEIAALLGGHTDVLSTTLAEIVQHHKSGDARVLGISSPERTKFVPDVPTYSEQGLNVVIYHWRGLFGPPDMPPAVLDYWGRAFAKMVDTPTWKQSMESINWITSFESGQQFRQSMLKEAAEAEAMLRPLGVLPEKKK